MQELSNYLRTVLAAKYTAVSYAIMQHGKIVASDALGVINQKENQPVNTKCTFNVASISKIYVTVAIMQLVEQGKITLDDPVYTILPKFTMRDERYKDITVHMLLDHTCALPGTQWKHFSLSQLDGVDYYEEVYHYLSTHHLKTDPGKVAVYCNDGFTVAEMVVAKVSGMPYADYVKTYITEPIGAHSTRLSLTLNPDYPLVSEGKKPQELLWIMGAAGVTTSMEDLCKFGRLFLEENDIISESSKKIMAHEWGTTFLMTDHASTRYGLGWDDVSATRPNYHLGEHVLTKGGNSFYFFSRLYILPKYDAVLAISASHDTKINPADEIIQLFAYYMNLQGQSIDAYTPLSSQDIDKYEGIYYNEMCVQKVQLFGSMMVLTHLNDDNEWVKDGVYFHKDNVWMDEKNEGYSFEENDGKMYLMHITPRVTYPESEKPLPYASFTQAWKERLGERYIVCDATPYDIVIATWFQAVTLHSVQDGILDVIVHYRKDAFTNEANRMPCVPVSDTRAEGFLDIPWNGSRDMIDPEFIEEDGREVLEMASYHYINVKSVKEYEQEGFPSGNRNGVYHITDLKEVPQASTGHRVMVLKEDLSFYWDSMDEEEYKPIEKGYMILV